EVRGLVDVGAELGDAGRRLEVEVVARVYAGLAEVAVEIAGVAELLHQRAQLAQVLAEVLRIDRGVLPPFPRHRLSRHERGRPEAGLADLPDLLGLVGVAEEL